MKEFSISSICLTMLSSSLGSRAPVTVKAVVPLTTNSCLKRMRSEVADCLPWNSIQRVLISLSPSAKA